MRNRSPRGFTLIELLIAMIMLALVGSAVLSLMLNMQRTARRQTEVAAMQGSLRNGLQLVQAELVELTTNSTAATPTSDLTHLGQQLMRYRAMRGIGTSCEITVAAVKIRKSSYAGLRVPTAGREGLLIYLEGDTLQVDDDAWETVPITAVTNSTCPDGDEAWSLVVTLLPTQTARATVPGPLRTYEDMEIGLKNDGVQDWLGIRSVSLGEAELEPVIGPLSSSGVEFTYLDAGNTVTANPPDVRSIVITLRGVTDRSVGAGFGASPSNPTDSLTLRVQLRNAR